VWLSADGKVNAFQSPLIIARRYHQLMKSQTITSKFKIGLLLLVIPSKLLLVSFTILLLGSFVTTEKAIEGPIIIIAIFFTLGSMLLIREAKFKWNRIKFESGNLEVSPFFGLGLKKRFEYKDVSFKRSSELSKTSDGNSVNVYVNDKRLIELSDAYYKNFNKLLHSFETRCNGGGKENISITSTLMNVFGKPIRL
jgi:hypothetical protein